MALESALARPPSLILQMLFWFLFLHWQFHVHQRSKRKDPKETHNAYNDPEYQDIINDMKAEILKQRESLGDTDADNPEILEIIKTHWNS